jgi:hypothetical protein
MGNKKRGEVPRSAAREGSFHLNSLKIERARYAVQHITIHTVKDN